MAFWHFKEVLCGRDKESFERAKGILEQNGIEYKSRLVGSHNILGGRNARTANIQYYIYVKKEDAEEAEYLLRR